MKISIVIPSYNNPVALSRTLDTLMHQTVRPDEIIVVDDGSNPPISWRDGVHIVRIDREAEYRGSSAAKNAGAEYSGGDWLIFSDDDILHMNDAIESIANMAVAMDTDKFLLNTFSTALPEGLLEQIDWSPDRMEYLDSCVSCVSGVTFKPCGEKRADNTQTAASEQHFSLINKQYFESLGGYDEDTFKSWGLNNQDLCIRVIKSGGAVKSNIRRVSDGLLLRCFHQWSPAVLAPSSERSGSVRDEEFKSKYGRHFSPNMLIEETHASG